MTEKKDNYCNDFLKRIYHINKNITKWEANMKMARVLYDSNYMTFWKRQHYGNNIKICSLLRKARWWEVNRRVWGSENTLYNIIMMNICHYTLSKVVECTTTKKLKPKVSYGLGVMMMCQRRFILGHKFLVSACMRTGHKGTLCTFFSVLL